MARLYNLTYSSNAIATNCHRLLQEIKRPLPNCSVIFFIPLNLEAQLLKIDDRLSQSVYTCTLYFVPTFLAWTRLLEPSLHRTRRNENKKFSRHASRVDTNGIRGSRWSQINIACQNPRPRSVSTVIGSFATPHTSTEMRERTVDGTLLGNPLRWLMDSLRAVDTSLCNVYVLSKVPCHVTLRHKHHNRGANANDCKSSDQK